MPEASLGKVELPIEVRAPIIYTQPLPVQNTWYNVLPTTQNIVLETVLIQVDALGETLEIRWIVDGLTYTGVIAAIAATPYAVYIFMQPTVGGELTAVSYPAVAPWGVQAGMYDNFEAQSCSIDIRKTTANGAGTLRAWVNYNVRI